MKTEKDLHNLRKLLRENILTSSSIKSTKSSNKFYSRTNLNNFNVNNTLSNEPKKVLSFSSLKYKPKRLINFKRINIPLPSLGKVTFDYSRTFVSENGSEIKSKKRNLYDFSKTNQNQNQTKLEQFIKDDNLIGFKNIYILKFAQFSDSFNKFHLNKDLIKDDKKREFEDLYNKIYKNLDLQLQTFLEDLEYEDDEGQNKKIFVSTYCNTISQSKSTIENNNKYINMKKKITGICSDFVNFVIKSINILFRELKENRNEIVKFQKNNHENELKINLLTKELDDLRGYINKYNLNKMIYSEKAKENSIRKIKEKYTAKENEYIISMFKFQKEINSLIQLLDKNKSYFNKYKDAEKEIAKNKKNTELLRINFHKELKEKNVKCAIERDQKEELMLKLNELNNIIDEFKEQKEKQARDEIETTAQILKLKNMVDEKSENIMMMSEELEYYMRIYNKEKNKYENTLNALRTLENRIFKEDNYEVNGNKKD
jgi:hypothetical protein